MAKLIVSPGANVLNRNYKGSTVYTRNNTVLMRQKHTTNHDLFKKNTFTSRLLKLSTTTYESLDPYYKQTFDDFVSLNPSYKSGINVMTKVNISANTADKTTFSPITEISPSSSPPSAPVLNILSVDKPSTRFVVSWSPLVDPIFTFRLFINLSYGSPSNSYSFFSSYASYPANSSPQTVVNYQIQYYTYVNIKAKFSNNDGLESPFSAVSSHLI